jgi:hypothetical protein
VKPTDLEQLKGISGTVKQEIAIPNVNFFCSFYSTPLLSLGNASMPLQVSLYKPSSTVRAREKLTEPFFKSIALVV